MIRLTLAFPPVLIVWNCAHPLENVFEWGIKTYLVFLAMVIWPRPEFCCYFPSDTAQFNFVTNKVKRGPENDRWIGSEFLPFSHNPAHPIWQFVRTQMYPSSFRFILMSFFPPNFIHLLTSCWRVKMRSITPLHETKSSIPSSCLAVNQLSLLWELFGVFWGKRVNQCPISFWSLI